MEESSHEKILHVLKTCEVVYVDKIIYLFIFIRFNFYYINDKRCNARTKLNFPSAVLFDAVAPYYPIQFKSKSNDPYKITRYYIQHEILSILHHDHDFNMEPIELSITKASHIIKTNDFDRVDNNEKNLAVLVSRIILEVTQSPILDPYYDDYGDGSE